MSFLNAAEIEKLLEKDGTWTEIPVKEFPDKMRAISGVLGKDRWLVVEHDGFDGGAPGLGYDGTLVVFPGHMYHLTPEIARTAYSKGRRWLDEHAAAKGI